jgi:hypothetical protein
MLVIISHSFWETNYVNKRKRYCDSSSLAKGYDPFYSTKGYDRSTHSQGFITAINDYTIYGECRIEHYKYKMINWVLLT